MSHLSVSCCFDGGNCEFVGTVAGSPVEVHVNVRNDPHTELEKVHHKQWFSFRVSGCRLNGESTVYKFVLANAGQCSYPEAWKDYNVCASYDHKSWFRVPSGFDAAVGQLHWTMDVACDQVYFAYFAPYSYERHLDLIARCAALAAGSNSSEVNIKNKSEVTVRSLGNSLDGRSMDLVTIGERFIFTA